MADDKKMTGEEALKAAFDAGRASALAEGAPDLFEFSNGQIVRGRGNQAEYEAALSAKVFELRGQGVKNVEKHPDVVALRAAHGRS